MSKSKKTKTKKTNVSSKFDIGRAFDKMKQKLDNMSGFSKSKKAETTKPSEKNTEEIPSYKKPIYDYIPVPPTTDSLRIRYLIECGKCDYIKPSNY